jgi:hypothetical protein
MWIRTLDMPAAAKTANAYLAVGARAEARMKLGSKWAVFSNVELHRTLTSLLLYYRITEVWSSPKTSLGLGIGLERRLP